MTALRKKKHEPVPITRPMRLEGVRNIGNERRCLDKAMEIEGAIAVSLVDHESGTSLASVGGNERFDIDVASAGNAAVVQRKVKVMLELGLDDEIEDVLVTLGGQYHVIRPLARERNLFLYLALDRSKANLGMARHKLMTIEKSLEI